MKHTLKIKLVAAVVFCLCTLINEPGITFAANFATGLPDYTADEEQRALGQKPFSDAIFAEDLVEEEVLSLSAGHASAPAAAAGGGGGGGGGGSVRPIASRSTLPALPKAISLKHGSLGKTQGDLGACTAFAIVSAIEQMTGIRFSATEFYFRALGHFDVDPIKGSVVSHYTSILHQGLVEADHFPDDATVHAFLEAAYKEVQASLPEGATFEDFVKAYLCKYV